MSLVICVFFLIINSIALMFGESRVKRVAKLNYSWIMLFFVLSVAIRKGDNIDDSDYIIPLEVPLFLAKISIWLLIFVVIYDVVTMVLIKIGKLPKNKKLLIEEGFDDVKKFFRRS